MKRNLLLLGALIMPFLVGCGTVHAGTPLAQHVRERPMPASEPERAKECTWIRAAMEHEQDAFNQQAVFARGLVAIYNRARLEGDLTVLQSRATAARCTNDFHRAYCGWHPLCWTAKLNWFADRRD